jgi:methylamine---glutamate N-methyltransferase subunit A
MCGIVGLLIKKPELRSRLGELLVPMLIGMSERGPDSAGLAVFTEPVGGASRKLSLYSGGDACDWPAIEAKLRQAFKEPHHLEVIANHAVLTTSADPTAVKQHLLTSWPALHVLSCGRAIDLYKDIGAPAEIARRYDFSKLTGTHLVGHTRMATESAVTPENAHPYTAGEDFCLVHNGSLSNPYSVRRRLEAQGIRFDGDCDTEAACRFLEYRMREGDDLQTALQAGFEELDGFYTFLMGTQDSLALVRDPFACKPAVVAETDDYVAIASEFRSLAKLPGVANANLFEPKPEQIYIWRADAA